jgi:hypothetical protein
MAWEKSGEMNEFQADGLLPPASIFAAAHRSGSGGNGVSSLSCGSAIRIRQRNWRYLACRKHALDLADRSGHDCAGLDRPIRETCDATPSIKRVQIGALRIPESFAFINALCCLILRSADRDDSP